MSLYEKSYEQFNTVFKQYHNQLCNYAYSFLKDHESSEDVVQETFIRIWEKRKDLLESDSIRFYLFTAVRNNCLTILEKGKKNIVVPLSISDKWNLAGEAQTDNHFKDGYKQLLKTAIQQLPDKCREVFLLSRISKQSYQEIADQLNISVKTVENHIGKALKMLRVFAKENKVALFIAWFIFFIKIL